MITIIFESHSTTIDNENKLSSGWNDIELSTLGINQAENLGTRRANEKFDAIFCSDLQRSYKTAQIAFGDSFPIMKDDRLRECDYGKLTQSPTEIVDAEKLNCISIPFPDGESYEQTTKRMKSFLQDLLKKYDGKKVMVIGHRATQYGLEFLINHRSLEIIIKSRWKWQPGWTYILEKI